MANKNRVRKEKNSLKIAAMGGRIADSGGRLICIIQFPSAGFSNRAQAELWVAQPQCKGGGGETTLTRFRLAVLH